MLLGILNSSGRFLIDILKQFAVDTLANVTYWHVILGLAEIIFMSYSLKEMLLARLGNFLLSFVLGGFYGQAINFGRYLANRTYYLETVKNIKRKRTWRTNVYDAVIDGLTTTIFWNVVFAIWLHYVVHLSWSHIGLATIGYTLVYIVFGGPYGKYLDWWRKKLIKKIK